MRTASKPLKVLIRAAALGLALLLLTAAVVWPHGFPERAEPRVGGTVDAGQTVVRIWFDEALVAGESTIMVKDQSGLRVDKGDGRVNQADPKLLEASLTPLGPGTYRVYWSVVTLDGHRIAADYRFRVR